MFKILFIVSSYDDKYLFSQIHRSLEEEYPASFSFSFFLCSELNSSPSEIQSLEKELPESDMIYILLHAGVSSFDKFESCKPFFWKKIPCFIHSTIEDENKEFVEQAGLSISMRYQLEKYYTLGGAENFRNMILYTASMLGEKKYPFENVQYLPWEGIYSSGIRIKEEKEFIGNMAEAPLVIALLFHGKDWNTKRIEVVDSFMKEIENLGATPYAVFTNSIEDLDIRSKGIRWTLKHYFYHKEKLIPKVLINLMGYSQSIFADPGDGKEIVEKSIFQDLGIPVIQAMSSYQNRETWEKDIRGLDPMALISNVYYPEFDGQLISVTACTCERIKDESGEREVFLPIVERVNKIVRLALSWAKLSVIPNRKKKVALILHNMPPRNDMIGSAFGLDTPNSLKNMTDWFSEIGIFLEYPFESGQEIINKIIQGVSNDRKWLNVEKVMEKSIDTVSKEKYQRWFLELENEVQKKIEEQWGKAPGEVMVYEDKFPIPGIVNGNVFIGLQPSRATEERAEEIYHSTDFILPHQYYAFYKWIKEEFRANVVYHIGTHGTLEWLPGKEIGLSRSCCPDFNIDDIPHLYPYSVNVTGEGLQAKRRSNAILISHMIPSLTFSDKYEEIEEMDELIKQYYLASLGQDGKKAELKQRIIETALKYHYPMDMNLSEEEIRKDEEIFLTRLHSYIEELKSSVIKDGLHILGEVEKGQRLVSLIHALLYVENSGMMAAEEAVAKSLSYSLESLQAKPYENKNGKTNLMILDDIRNMTDELIESILKRESYEPIFLKYPEYHVKEEKYIRDLEKNILERILPKIEAGIQEKESILRGVMGKFVLPGQSGCPTRGNINILPTGTNFYAIDPCKIPSRASWKVGKRLAEVLMERYREEEGRFPENIAMIIYSGDTMKTNGDDIAEVLYLMGVKPVWQKNGDRVIGLEVIPYAELQRPRIDVSLRISGLFRDTFPNLIRLIEEAVNMVASLEEEEDINYIKKNIRESTNALLQEGCSIEEAVEFSKLRVFGCPPGTYGTGVSTLIESRNWTRREDLGRAYIQWSSHAYSSHIHGKQLETVFMERLKKTEVTVKNEPSIEIDMLESDDYYAYHGGLTAAVRYVKGENAKSYSGNSSNPQNIKIKSLQEEAARIMRARILNPKWLDGLKKHDYKGALELSSTMDILFGWDATAEIIENWMYDKVMEKYILNPENREWIKKNNSHALLNITEKLLEAEKRGMWKSTAKGKEALSKIYLSIEGDIEEIEE